MKNPFSSVRIFTIEIVDELKKCTWPTMTDAPWLHHRGDRRVDHTRGFHQHQRLLALPVRGPVHALGQL